MAEKMISVTLKEGAVLQGERHPRKVGEPPAPVERTVGDGKTKVKVAERLVIRHPQSFVEGDEVVAKAKEAEQAEAEKAAKQEAKAEAEK